MPSLRNALDDELRRLEAAGLLRAPVAIAGGHGRSLDVSGRRLVNFASNDYLGLAGHPEIVDAVARALFDRGTGAGASRLISGTSDLHREAEEGLARFVRRDEALLFASGYAANVGMLSALACEEDLILSDTLNHASIIDGCRLSRARVHVVANRDVRAIDALLTRHRGSARRALVVTDAVFSMDGTRAPLAELRAVCDAHDAWLVVDEAHALGVHGPSGRGLGSEVGIEPDVLVGTLGKAFGVAGAFVAGPRGLRAFLENRARSFVFSTAMPPAIAAGIVRATSLVERGDDLRARCLAHAARLHARLSPSFRVPSERSAIVPVVLGDPERAVSIGRALFERGYFAPGIRPPTVPQGTSRLRLAMSAAHSSDDVDGLADAIFESARIAPESRARP